MLSVYFIEGCCNYRSDNTLVSYFITRVYKTLNPHTLAFCLCCFHTQVEMRGCMITITDFGDSISFNSKSNHMADTKPHGWYQRAEGWSPAQKEKWSLNSSVNRLASFLLRLATMKISVALEFSLSFVTTSFSDLKIYWHQTWLLYHLLCICAGVMTSSYLPPSYFLGIFEAETWLWLKMTKQSANINKV